MIALLLVPVASGYELSGYAWPPERLPLEIHWTGAVNGLTQDETRAALEGAVDAWNEAGPCAFGIVAVEDPAARQWFLDGGVSVAFGDPQRVLSEGVAVGSIAGMTGVEYTFDSNGTVFTTARSFEIVVNDGDIFASDAVIDAGTCQDRISLQGALTHELGHLLGLQHPCDQVDSCTPEELESTMYWALSECDTGPSSLAEDDIAGLQAIYGDAPPIEFSCAADLDDPLSVACTIDEPAGASTMNPTWTFGQGAGAEGIEVTHTYDRAAVYPIELCLQIPDCGDTRCETQYYYAEDAPSDVDTDSVTRRNTCTHADSRSTLAVLLLLALTARRRAH